MIDIVQIIFEQFSSREIDKKSQYWKLMQDLIDCDSRLQSSLSTEQLFFYNALQKSSDELQSENDYELIKFVLEFVNRTLNYKD